MSASKVQQNRFKRPLRMVVVTAALLLLVAGMSLTVVLNSKRVQQGLFDTYVAPALAEYHLEADFKGFEYSFPASIQLSPIELYYQDLPVAEFGPLEIADIFWSYKMGISAVRLSSLRILEDLKAPLFQSLMHEFKDSSATNSAHFSPLTLDLGSVIIDTVQFSFDSTKVSNRLVIDHLIVGEHIVVTGIDLSIRAKPYAARAAVSQLEVSPSGEYSLDYSIQNDSIASVVGRVEGGEESIMFTGDLVASTHLSLHSFGASSFEPLSQGTQIGFNATTDSSGLKLRIFGGNSSYIVSGSLSAVGGENYEISSQITLQDEFYNWPVLDDFESFFDVFKPKSIDFSAKTDFSDVSWEVQLADKKNTIVLGSEGLHLPVRGTLNSKDLAVGPLQNLRAQFSLLPNISAVVNEQSIEVLAAISSLTANDVEVRGINAKYEHSLDRDTLWFSSLDPNFDLEIKGRRQGNVNTLQGELNSLNLALLDPLDTGLTLMATAALNVSDQGLGSLLLQNVVLQRSEDVVFLRELSLTHRLTKKVRSLELSSDVLDFSINGQWDFGDFSKVGVHVFQDMIVQEPQPWFQSQFNFDLTAGNVSWIADLAHLDFQISEDTRIFGKYDSKQENWSTTAFIPSLSFEDFEAYGIMLGASQKGTEHHSTFRANSMRYDPWKLNNLNLVAKGSEYKHNISFSGTLEDSIPSNIALSGSLSKGTSELSAMKFNIGASVFSLDKSTSIKWSNDLLTVDTMLVQGANGSFLLAGELLSTEDRELGFDIIDLDSKVINYILRNGQTVLSGKLSSSVTLTKSLSTPDIAAQILYKDFGLNGFDYGNFSANARLKEFSDLRMRGQLLQGRESAFYFNGKYDFASEEIEVRVSLDKFLIHPFNPFLGGIIDDLQGNLRGGLELFGTLGNYVLDGGFTLSNGHFKLPIVGAALSTSLPVEIALSEKEISIDSALFFVPSDSTLATVYGGITHNRFDSIKFNLKLHGDSIRAVEMKRNLDGYFYGTAVVMGDLLLEGPLEQLHLDLSLATKEGTNFKIPLDNPTAVEMPSYIRFTDANLPKADSSITQELEYFTTDIAIQATPDAAIELVLDEVLGDVIKARGSGNLRLKLLEDESLELYGLYTLESGDYLFTLQNIINKPFEVIPGGSILWSGDLYEAEVNIDAKYSLSTDLQGLVTNANYNNENVDVDLIINLSGALMNPNITFTVDLPNAPASYLEELERHFLNEDAMNYQAFSLLLLGEFFQQDLAVQEGFDFGGSVGRNTSELLVSEFGSWLSAGIGSYVDLELDYTTGTNPYATIGNVQNNLNLGLGKDFLDGRLSVNSSLDIPLGQSGTSTLLLGDTEVVYSLTKDGKIKLRAFNRSNRNDPLMQNSGPYTQGVGILYHKEFEKVLSD